MNKYTDFIETSGDGLWSDVKKTVKVIGYDVHRYSDVNDFAELKVYFSTKTWNVDKDGLIYTDTEFLRLVRLAFGTNDIHYSEQGMQGDNYVSFDVGSEFIGEWCNVETE